MLLPDIKQEVKYNYYPSGQVTVKVKKFYHVSASHQTMMKQRTTSNCPSWPTDNYYSLGIKVKQKCIAAI